MKQPIRLASGRIVDHKPMPNGSHEAFMRDGCGMSQAEWDEYCNVCFNVANAQGHRFIVGSGKQPTLA